jgi:hypothetical protein
MLKGIADLEEARMREQAGMAPEAGVHRIRRIALQKIVCGEIPHDAPVGGADLRFNRPSDKAALRKIFILAIRPRQRPRHRLVRRARGVRDLRMRRAEREHGDKRQDDPHRLSPQFCARCDDENQSATPS